jgi:mannitol/fructose-specific phosphotransferase system IIA component (Ntr-type)
LVFAKIAESVAATKRILAVFMPTSEKNSDITLYLAQIKHLSSQLNAGITFYLSESQKDKILEKTNKFLKSTVKYKMIVKSHWNAIKRELPNDIRSSDSVVLFMGTRQKLFRSPAMDKYPLLLSDKFKKNNIFAVYPSLSFVASQDEENLFEENAPSKTNEHINIEALETKTCDFESVIASISQKTEICANEIYNILFSSLELYPVELISGVVLIHAHTEAVEEPRIFLWFQKEKREISPSKTSANVLITVLNPLNGDPQVHLKTLSAIAGIFTNPKSSEIIENAKNSEELIKNLQNL